MRAHHAKRREKIEDLRWKRLIDIGGVQVAVRGWDNCTPDEQRIWWLFVRASYRLYGATYDQLPLGKIDPRRPLPKPLAFVTVEL